MSQSLEVLIYKILQYASQCIEADTEPSIDEMRKLSKGNKTMFVSAMKECESKNLLSGLYIPDYVNTKQSSVYGSHVSITIEGREFLEENSKMKKIAASISDNALSVIETAVQATIRAASGL